MLTKFLNSRSRAGENNLYPGFSLSLLRWSRIQATLREREKKKEWGERNSFFSYHSNYNLIRFWQLSYINRRKLKPDILHLYTLRRYVHRQSFLHSSSKLLGWARSSRADKWTYVCIFKMNIRVCLEKKSRLFTKWFSCSIQTNAEYLHCMRRYIGKMDMSYGYWTRSTHLVNIKTQGYNPVWWVN